MCTQELNPAERTPESTSPQTNETQIETTEETPNLETGILGLVARLQQLAETMNLQHGPRYIELMEHETSTETEKVWYADLPGYAAADLKGKYSEGVLRVETTDGKFRVTAMSTTSWETAVFKMVNGRLLITLSTPNLDPLDVTIVDG